MKNLIITIAVASCLASCASTGSKDTAQAEKAETAITKAGQTQSQDQAMAAPSKAISVQTVTPVSVSPSTSVAVIDSSAASMSATGSSGDTAVPAKLAAAQSSAAVCDTLYADYASGLQKFPEPKARKKRSLFSSIAGSGIATMAAGLAGVNTGVLQAISAADRTASLVKQTQDIKFEIDNFNNVKNRAELQSQTYDLAKQNGCSEKKLRKIAKTSAK